MPVYEVKNPEPPRGPGGPEKESPRPVNGVRPVIRIRRYEGTANRREQMPGSRRAGDEKSLRQLIEQVNGDLERHHVPIHLVLLAAEGGFLLEVYDCTDRKVCRAVHDLVIDIGELPTLLHKLQQEAGLLVDTFS